MSVGAPDPHCRISSVRFKGSEFVWILPRGGIKRMESIVGRVFCRLMEGAAVRINDGVIEVRQGD